MKHFHSVVFEPCTTPQHAATEISTVNASKLQGRAGLALVFRKAGTDSWVLSLF